MQQRVSRDTRDALFSAWTAPSLSQSQLTSTFSSRTRSDLRTEVQVATETPCLPPQVQLKWDLQTRADNTHWKTWCRVCFEMIFTLKLLVHFTSNYKGFKLACSFQVVPNNLYWLKFYSPYEAIRDAEFVSSSEQIWRNLALHLHLHLCI